MDRRRSCRAGRRRSAAGRRRSAWRRCARQAGRRRSGPRPVPAGGPRARSAPRSHAPDRTRSDRLCARRPAPGRCAAAPPGRSPEWRRFARPGRPPGSASVGCTVSRLAVMFTKVARGTTTRSAPMRAKLTAMPSRSAQPATKLAKPMPTPSMTATPSRIARSWRRATFWAANRISSQRSCRRCAIALSMGLFSQENVPGLIDLRAEILRAAELRTRPSAPDGGALP